MLTTTSIIVLIFVLLGVVDSKYVHVTLSASWPETSLLSEFCQAVPREIFWRCMDAARSVPWPCAPEAEFAMAEDIGAALLGASMRRLATAELAARAHSVAVEADHRQRTIDAGDACQGGAVVIAGNRTWCSHRDVSDIPWSALACVETHDDDHVSSGSGCARGVLYGAIEDPETHAFIAAMHNAKVTFVYRWSRPSQVDNRWASPVALMGYGATLDIKNMEYKPSNERTASTTEKSANDDAHPVGDDDVEGVKFDVLRSRRPDLAVLLTEAEQNLKAHSSAAMTIDLKLWQMQRLAFQAAEYIVEGGGSFARAKRLTEDFPLIAATLSARSESPDFEAAVSEAAARWQAGENALYINGRRLPNEEVNLFTALRMIRESEMLRNALQEAILSGVDIAWEGNVDSVVTAISQCSKEFPQPKVPRVHVPSEVIMWLNDLEKDRAYARLSKSIRGITQINRYGQPSFPRRNIINVVFALNPLDCKSLVLGNTIYMLLSQGAPAHVGLLLYGEDFPSAVVKEYSTWFGTSTHGSVSDSAYILAALDMLRDNPLLQAQILAQLDATCRSEGSVGLDEVENVVAEAGLSESSVRAHATSDAFISSQNALRDAQKRMGNIPVPSLIMNGHIYVDDVEHAIHTAFRNELQQLISWVNDEVISDNDRDMYATIMKVSNAAPRFQAALYAEPQYITLGDAESQSWLQRVQAFHPPGYALETIEVTHVLVIGERVDDNLARQRVLDFAQYLERSKAAVKGYFVVEGHPHLHRIIGKCTTPSQIIAALEEGIDMTGVIDDVIVVSLIQCPTKWVTQPSAVTIISNGRTLTLPDDFMLDDFFAWESTIASSSRGFIRCAENADLLHALTLAFGAETVGSAFVGVKLVALQSLLWHDHFVRGEALDPLAGLVHRHRYTVTVAGGDHAVTAVINPVGRAAQVLVALADTLHTALNATATIVVNPPSGALTALPVKNFFRWAFAARPTFAEGRVVPAGALFRAMPTNVVMTLGTVEPEGWLVASDVAEEDIDNIKLEDVAGVSATYRLKALTVSGKALDVKTHEPPRGLPLTLTQGAEASDTLVMANYGYFQLRAGPGPWLLDVQAAAAEVYEILDIRPAAHFFTARPQPRAVPSSWVRVRSLLGAQTVLDVKKRSGHEKDNILWSPKVTRAWPPSGPAVSPPTSPTLNIFTVASGHLYERLLRIMLYTATRASKDRHGANTTRIKFWLIDNFLSPQFRASLPRVAEAFGFEYGYVTYRWPHWLRAQTEKQRTIWAYKILFLDVLFPLEVEKILFVDADQIVQGDLHDLYNLPLEGRAVGYTPFCRQHRNPETSGFRFWESGYWVDHLRGLPYHISAIYVVDILKLRQLAAGDQYRGIYDSLSADPNSLSNLDQDLPNFAQHQVPIFSLPEEWLWCETWCSESSKASAKTIDLCNNPMTKMSKLENARRIIPNWDELDRIASLEQPPPQSSM